MVPFNLLKFAEMKLSARTIEPQTLRVSSQDPSINMAIKNAQEAHFAKMAMPLLVLGVSIVERRVLISQSHAHMVNLAEHSERLNATCALLVLSVWEQVSFSQLNAGQVTLASSKEALIQPSYALLALTALQ